MTKLSDTQAVILSAASQRDDGAVLPLPETLKIRGGAVDKVLGSLEAKGLIEHRGSRRGDNPPPLRITRAGLEAIGVEPEDAGDIQRGATEGARLADAADVEGLARSGAPAPDTQHGAATTRTPRAGTKQALMIALLRRPEGATVEQIAAATGWQHHTIRGAISGALKKRLSLTIQTTRDGEVGPNQSGARGSTVYRITGSDPETGNKLGAG
jgi:predicted ArsR family transcriptional regulator